MNRNKRKLKLPSSKKVRLGLHLETRNIHASSVWQSPGPPKAWFYPVGCSLLRPFSAPTVPAHVCELQLLGKCWNKSQLLELSSALRKCLQWSSCIYWTFMEQFLMHLFSIPAVIHLLHLDFWACYSFPKLKCFLRSKISLVFKSKIGFL